MRVVQRILNFTELLSYTFHLCMGFTCTKKKKKDTNLIFNIIRNGCALPQQNCSLLALLSGMSLRTF